MAIRVRQPTDHRLNPKSFFGFNYAMQDQAADQAARDAANASPTDVGSSLFRSSGPGQRRYAGPRLRIHGLGTLTPDGIAPSRRPRSSRSRRMTAADMQAAYPQSFATPVEPQVDLRTWASEGGFARAATGDATSALDYKASARRAGLSEAYDRGMRQATAAAKGETYTLDNLSSTRSTRSPSRSRSFVVNPTPRRLTSL